MTIIAHTRKHHIKNLAIHTTEMRLKHLEKTTEHTHNGPGLCIFYIQIIHLFLFILCTHSHEYLHELAALNPIKRNECNNNKKWWQTISINDYQIVNGSREKKQHTRGKCVSKKVEHLQNGDLVLFLRIWTIKSK